MSVYLNPKHLDTPVHRLDQEKMRAPQQIGDIFARLKALSRAPESEGKSAQMTRLLGRLGVDQTDQSAREALLPILEKCFHKDIVIVADAAMDNTGIYYLKEKSEPFAEVQIDEGFRIAQVLSPTVQIRIDRSNPDYTDLEALEAHASFLSAYFDTKISVQQIRPGRFSFSTEVREIASLEVDEAADSIQFSLSSEQVGAEKGGRRASARKLQDGLGQRVILKKDKAGENRFTLEKNKAFAVFKIGTKRARMEILVRHIAHMLGLERHAIPGIFCSIRPPIRKPTEREMKAALERSDEDDFCPPGPEFTPLDFPDVVLSEELYNGHQKVHQPGTHDDNYGLDTPYTLTGILEPYIFETAPMNAQDFIHVTMTALAVGHRDGKADGIIDKTLVDPEECMPDYLDPGSDNQDEEVAATHLPFLENILAHRELLDDQLAALANLVNGWAPFQIAQDLSNQGFLFVDEPSEEMELDSEGWDHGGCRVQIEPLRGKVVPIDVSKGNLLTDKQISVCLERIIRLKASVLKAKNFEQSLTAVLLTGAVDPFWAAHYEAYRESPACPSPAHIAGYLSPSALSRSYSGRSSVGAGAVEPSPPALSNMPPSFFKDPEAKSDD